MAGERARRRPATKRTRAVDAGLRGVARARRRSRPGRGRARRPARAGNARATAIVDQPWPQPTSATRARGVLAGARRRRASPPSQPVGQLVGEGRAVDVALAVAELGAVGGVGHAAAGAVGLGDPRQHAADAGEHVREGGDVGGVVGPRQRRGRARRAARSGARRARRRRRRRRGGRRRPAARATRARSAGRCRPLRPARRAVSGPRSVERAVEAELGAEVDGAQLERAERGAEEALDEGVGACRW